MASAAEKLARVLASVPISDAVGPVVANVTADYVAGADEIKDALARQIAGSVRWEESIARMAAGGVETFVEVGSGKVLTGLIKRIAPSAKTVNVNDAASLSEFAGD
jgi:[acyl-carrier-protein] S-malonyltransferase